MLDPFCLWLDAACVRLCGAGMPIETQPPLIVPPSGVAEGLATQGQVSSGPGAQWLSLLPPGVSKALRPNQLAAVQHVLACLGGFRKPEELGAILALSMGLGKTLITLAAVCALLQAPCPHPVRHALILCPVGLVENWMAEIEKWMPPGVATFISLTARSSMEQFVSCSPVVLVCGFDSFLAYRTHFEMRGMPCEMFVVDEAHKVTNMATDLYQLMLTVPTSRRLLLSGTPMRNNDMHYYFALLHLCQPGSFGTAATFERLFEQPLRAMGTVGADESRGRRAMQVLARKTGCVLAMDDSALRAFLPQLTEVLLLAEPTTLQVALLKHLMAKPRLRTITTLTTVVASSLPPSSCVVSSGKLSSPL